VSPKLAGEGIEYTWGMPRVLKKAKLWNWNGKETFLALLKTFSQQKKDLINAGLQSRSINSPDEQGDISWLIFIWNMNNK